VLDAAVQSFDLADENEEIKPRHLARDACTYAAIPINAGAPGQAEPLVETPRAIDGEMGYDSQASADEQHTLRTHRDGNPQP
jgi:hypothetical protein